MLVKPPADHDHIFPDAENWHCWSNYQLTTLYCLHECCMFENSKLRRKEEKDLISGQSKGTTHSIAEPNRCVSPTMRLNRAGANRCQLILPESSAWLGGACCSQVTSCQDRHAALMCTWPLQHINSFPSQLIEISKWTNKWKNENGKLLGYNLLN
jgi:hypothetical protein